MTAVKDTIGKCSHWEVDESLVSIADQLAQRVLEVKPTAATAGVTHQRIAIFHANNGNGSTQGSSQDTLNQSSTGAKNNATSGNMKRRMAVNYSFDAGEAFNIAAGAGKANWKNPWMNGNAAADNAYFKTEGSNAASVTGYYVAGRDYNSAQVTHMMCIESAEVLALFMWVDASTVYVGFIAGAMGVTPDGNTRIYGLMTSGDSNINSQMHAGGQRFTTSATQGGPSYAQFVCFDPYLSNDRVIQAWRQESSTVASPNYTTPSNTRVHLPISYKRLNSADGAADVTDAFFGSLRQIRIGEDAINRTIIRTEGASGAIKSYYFCPSNGAGTADALAFDQG
jgi:hypothetical protein